MLNPSQQRSLQRQPNLSPGFAMLEPLAGLLSLLFLTLLGQPLYSLLNNQAPEHLPQDSTLISHLEFARQEAMRLKMTVTVCPSQDGKSCQSGGDWREGWVIFTDESRPSRHNSSGDKFLHRQAGEVNPQPLVAMDIIRYQADGSILLN
jgi:type IV fimbrial biogenesis protein FimT